MKRILPCVRVFRVAAAATVLTMKPKSSTLAGLALAAALCFSQSLSATPIALIDFQSTNGNGGPVSATLADFNAAGVVEDIAGGTIDYFGSGINTSFSSATGNVTVAFSPQSVKGYVWGPLGTNAVVYDGAYLGSSQGATTVTVSNLNIDSGTTYKLYIWGASNASNQEGTFTFNGSTITPGTTVRETPAVFTFDSTTAGVTSNSVAFQFARVGSNAFGVINGVAIVAVPEPFAYGPIAGFLALGWGMLRRRK